MQGEPGGGLIVSGGGLVAVSTPEIIALAERMRQVQTSTEQGHRRLLTLSGRRDVTDAATALLRAAESADFLALMLRLSADAYGHTEQMLQFAGATAAAGLGFTLGRLAPLIAFAIGVALGTRLFPGAFAELGAWIADNPRLVFNPLVVTAVRLMVSASDEMLAGLFGVPPAVAQALGDQGLGVLGLVQTTALLLAGLVGVAGLGQAKHLKETAVSVRPSSYSSRPVTAPSGVGELIDRIPGSAEGEAQIRLERYSDKAAPGGASGRWILYLGGTIDLGVLPGDEPFDMTSNLYATAGLDAGSLRAATTALNQAGVQPGDPVLAVGYSQGGLLAAQLERGGEFNVQGVLTVGAPIGQLAMKVPTAAIAHTEDLAPALGGLDTTTSDDRIGSWCAAARSPAARCRRTMLCRPMPSPSIARPRRWWRRRRSRASVGIATVSPGFSAPRRHRER